MAKDNTGDPSPGRRIHVLVMLSPPDIWRLPPGTIGVVFPGTEGPVRNVFPVKRHFGGEVSGKAFARWGLAFVGRHGLTYYGIGA